MVSRTFMLLLLLSITAIAATQEHPGPEIDLNKIRIEQQELLVDVETGSIPYNEMSTQARQKLAVHQRRLLSLMEGKSDFDALTEDEKMEVFNLLETIRARTSEVEDERLICTRQKRKASLLTVRVCKTVAQMRKEREAAQALLDKPGACLSQLACSGKP